MREFYKDGQKQDWGLDFLSPEDRSPRVTHSKSVWHKFRVLLRHGVWPRYEPAPEIGGIDRRPVSYWKTKEY